MPPKGHTLIVKFSMYVHYQFQQMYKTPNFITIQKVKTLKNNKEYKSLQFKHPIPLNEFNKHPRINQKQK